MHTNKLADLFIGFGAYFMCFYCLLDFIADLQRFRQSYGKR